MNFKRVKVVVFAPRQSADAVRQAIGDAGGGQIGQYSFCSFSLTGIGRFKPSPSAQPHIGTPNQLAAVEEERIEFVCDKAQTKSILAAIRQVHPYEEVAFDILPLLAEEDL